MWQKIFNNNKKDWYILQYLSEEQTKNENKFTINLKIPFMTKHLFLENGWQLNLRILAAQCMTLANGKCKGK